MISTIVCILCSIQFTSAQTSRCGVGSNDPQCARALTGSTSQCPPGADPAVCGQASVLRGQSHIGIPAACFNKVDPGPCSQDLIRIFYDSRTYTCKAFSYSGCGGNANRFVSVKNCYKLCHPFYRQRFINLGQNAANKEPKAEAAKAEEKPAAAPESLVDLKPKTKRKTTTATESATETTEVTTTEEPKNNGTEEKKERKKRSSSGSEAREQRLENKGMAFAPQNIDLDLFVDRRGQAVHSAHGMLRNIQHQNYSVLGGFLLTRDGDYKPQAVQKEMFILSHYKK